MVDYVATFKESFSRVSGEARQKEFLDSFYDRFIAADEEVAAAFRETDMKHQKQMLQESLAEMMDFSVTHKSNPYLLTLARIHGARGRDISPHMFDLWLESLIASVREVDPECNDNVELSWRLVMAPGIEFMKFYRNR